MVQNIEHLRIQPLPRPVLSIPRFLIIPIIDHRLGRIDRISCAEHLIKALQIIWSENRLEVAFDRAGIRFFIIMSMMIFRLSVVAVEIFDSPEASVGALFKDPPARAICFFITLVRRIYNI